MSNPSGIWKVVNSILNPTVSTTSLTFLEEAREIRNEKEVADVFNGYFVDKIRKLRDGIKKENVEDPFKRLKNKRKANDAKFSLHTISENQVQNVISKLKNKNSCGFDGINS